MKPTTFALVGTGGRAMSFIEPLANRFARDARLVALCDVSPTRMAYYNARLAAWGHGAVPAYHARDFGRLLAATRPDTVFVCSKDSTHHTYIIRALTAGCDVVTEKPMTIDAAKCRAVLGAARAASGSLRVAFNYRWSAHRTRIKELLAGGAVGRVHHVTLEYLLDTSHGADYFRRWHAHAAESGGLLVHKSTHHFDLVNWWLDAIPAQVFAYGGLFFYGAKNARARGDGRLARYRRYTGAAAAARDPFRLDLADGGSLEKLYLAAEKDSGYLRDRNVFRDDIDIQDVMSVNVRYRTGELLTYSLTCFSPREGMRVCFNGDRGRLEYEEYRATHIIRGQSDAELDREQSRAADSAGETIRVYPHFRPSYEVPVRRLPGGHSGSDPLLAEQIFSRRPPRDRWGRAAGHEQGAASILVGIAANKSIATNHPVNLADLVALKPKAAKLSELV